MPRSTLALPLTLAALLSLGAAGEREVRSGAAERAEVALTLYGQDFGLVREVRDAELGTGRLRLELEGVATTLEPETVLLQAEGLRVLEQTDSYESLTPQALLAAHVGRPVRVYRWNERAGEDEAIEATLLSAGEPPLLRIGDEITWGVPGRLAFPVASGWRPVGLRWLVESTQARPRLELSYLARGLSWRADYVLVVDDSETRADLVGWATLHNSTGVDFENARVKLVAGDVQRVSGQPPYVQMERRKLGIMAQEAAADTSEEALSELHLYALERPATLRHGERAQIALLESRGLAVQRRLELRGQPYLFRGAVGEGQGEEHVAVVLEFANRDGKASATPLPAGVVRVYRTDSEGAQQLVGEDRLDHTPRDATVRVRLGTAFDVTARRRQMDYRALGRCSSESAWRVDLRNARDAALEVDVYENAEGDWEIIQSSLPATKEDARSFRFRVPLKARATAALDYRVRVRWC